MSKKKAKGVKSHLNAKSTAKLHKEISELLEQNIPDPEAPLAKTFGWEPEDEETVEARERAFEENIVDRIDEQDIAKEQDEDSRRY